MLRVAPGQSLDVALMLRQVGVRGLQVGEEGPPSHGTSSLISSALCVGCRPSMQDLSVVSASLHAALTSYLARGPV